MLILTHIGISLPEYIDYCLRQIRIWNSDIKIIFLVNECNLFDPVFEKYNVETVQIETLHNDNINRFISNFGNGDSFTHLKNIEYSSGDFWCITSTRLFYLYEFCKNKNINEYFYFENDIMIYENLNKLKEKIKCIESIKDQIFVTKTDDYMVTTGLMYVSKNETLGFILDEINNYLLNREIDKYISEMTLLGHFTKKNPNKVMYFPLLHDGNYSEYFHFFESIFDGATLGQYVDGTPTEPGTSLKIWGHLKDAINDRELNVEFIEEDGKKIPFIIIDSRKIKISNLHIHSKRLNLFFSN